MRTRSIRLLTYLALGILLLAPGLDGRANTLANREELARGEGRVPRFYDRGSAAVRAGRLIARERLEPELMLENAASGYRIVYGSTDGLRGSGSTVVSGAVFLPRGPAPSGGWPVVAWAHGSVGMADICAPSIQGRSLRDAIYLNRWLAEGYAVVATDYQGLGTPGPHPYINARAAAYSVLDSLRAARSGFRQLSGRSAIIGQSQGAHAAIAAALYASAYAPDLDIRAVVATGTPYYPAGQDVDGFLKLSRPTMEYLMYLMLAAQQTDGSLETADLVTDIAMPLYRQTGAVCISRFEFDILGSKLDTPKAIRTPGLRRALGPLLPTLSYPHLRAKAPIFLGIGGTDEDVSADSQMKLAKDACAQGSSVEAHLYQALGHSGAMAGSLDDSVPFLAHAMRGETAPKPCGPPRLH